jgi:hypothetical protein
MEDEKENLKKQRKTEYNRQYREKNREKIYQNNKAYREKHPELFHAYYHKHKERITTRRKEIVHCDCCNHTYIHAYKLAYIHTYTYIQLQWHLGGGKRRGNGRTSDRF